MSRLLCLFLLGACAPEGNLNNVPVDIVDVVAVVEAGSPSTVSGQVHTGDQHHVALTVDARTEVVLAFASEHARFLTNDDPTLTSVQNLLAAGEQVRMVLEPGTHTLVLGADALTDGTYALDVDADVALADDHGATLQEASLVSNGRIEGELAFGDVDVHRIDSIDDSLSWRLDGFGQEGVEWWTQRDHCYRILDADGAVLDASDDGLVEGDLAVDGPSVWVEVTGCQPEPTSYAVDVW